MALSKKISEPEPKRRKIIIVATIIAIVCLAASGSMYFVLKGDSQDSGRRDRQRWRDANLPDVRNQSYDEVMAFRNSDKYKKLSQREQMMYSMMSGRQVMEHNMETYFTIPKEQRTAYLDKMIDEMQAQRAKFEQMRGQFPRPQRPRDGNDVNDPNRAARIAERIAQRNNPSNVRSMSERGTALRRAQREQFMQAMQKRMKERGISMPRFGGGPGGGGRRGR